MKLFSREKFEQFCC